MEADELNARYPGMWLRFFARMIDTVFQIILGSPFLIMMTYVVIRSAANSPGGLENFTADSLRFTPRQSLAIGACSAGYVAISALYVVLMHASRLQGTLGKRILGMKVVDERNGRITLGASVNRFFALEILGIPSSLLGNSTNSAGKRLAAMSGFVYGAYFMISALVGSADPRKRTIHDRFAKTYVVYRKLLGN